MSQEHIMKRISAIASVLAALVSTSALAKGEIPFEKVKGWDIERTGQTCLMTKAWKDKSDNNAQNAVIFGLAQDQVIFTLVYEHWTWDKNEKVTVPLALDKKVVSAKSKWIGDAETLTTQLPASFVPGVLASKAMVLKFENGDAGFELAGFRCNAARAQPVTVAATPPEANIVMFSLGAMVESAIKECDVPTTGTERSAFAAKLAGLRTEMGPIAAPLQADVDKRPEPRCPKGDEAVNLQQTVRDFNAMTPTEFMASVQKRSADAHAAKAVKP
jgi:hypothetical protein